MEWIEDNIKKMIEQIMQDARYQRPLPTAINLHGLAYKKFIEILKSKSMFIPEENMKFLGIPVYKNNTLPLGTFTVERWKEPTLNN